MKRIKTCAALVAIQIGLTAGAARAGTVQLGQPDEAILYSLANNCLRVGDYACALDKTAELTGRFPGSELTDMVLAIEARAAVAAGKTSRAAAAVSRLRDSFPMSRSFTGLEDSIKRLVAVKKVATGPSDEISSALSSIAAPSPGLNGPRVHTAAKTSLAATAAAVTAVRTTTTPIVKDALYYIRRGAPAALEDKPAVPAVATVAATAAAAMQPAATQPATVTESMQPVGFSLVMAPQSSNLASVGPVSCFDFQLSAAGLAVAEKVGLSLYGLDSGQLSFPGGSGNELELLPGAVVKITACGTVPDKFADGDQIEVGLKAAPLNPAGTPAAARLYATVSRASFRVLFHSQPRNATSEGTPLTLTVINTGMAAGAETAVTLTVDADARVELSRRRFLLGVVQPGEIITLAANAKVAPQGAAVAFRYCVEQRGAAPQCAVSAPQELR